MFPRGVRKLITLCLLASFSVSVIVTPLPVHAQMDLPEPGTMVNLSPAFKPLMIKGVKVHPENPLRFDFLVDTGDDTPVIPAQAGIQHQEQLKQQSQRLINYFLACLTIPEDDLWVNLSPYEKDRMIPDALGKTELGRDLLAQDYILKQLTASMIYPEKELGKAFWDRVYAKAQQLYGTSEIPVNTFNKVWILADTAKVFESNNTAFVVNAHLKVMLDEDYTAMNKNKNVIPAKAGIQNEGNVASQIIREIILPELEKEINTGKNFATIRQIFHAFILATWYKKNLKQAILNKVYSDKAKVSGLAVIPAQAGIQDMDPDAIYQRYLKAYKKGVFNYIKEESGSQLIPRKYFSGGTKFSAAQIVTSADAKQLDPAAISEIDRANYRVQTDMANAKSNSSQPPNISAAMSVDEIKKIPDLFKRINAEISFLLEQSIRIAKLDSFSIFIKRGGDEPREVSFSSWAKAHSLVTTSDLLKLTITNMRDGWDWQREWNRENIHNYPVSKRPAMQAIIDNNPALLLNIRLEKMQSNMDILQGIVRDNFHEGRGLLDKYKGSKDSPIPEVSLSFWMMNKVFGKDDKGRANLRVVQEILSDLNAVFELLKQDLQLELNDFRKTHPDAVPGDIGDPISRVPKSTAMTAQVEPSVTMQYSPTYPVTNEVITSQPPASSSKAMASAVGQFARDRVNVSEKGNAAGEFVVAAEGSRQGLLPEEITRVDESVVFIKNAIVALEAVYQSKTDDYTQKKKRLLDSLKKAVNVLESKSSAGKVVSSPIIVHGKNDFALGFKTTDRLILGKEMFGLEVPLLARYIAELLIDLTNYVSRGVIEELFSSDARVAYFGRMHNKLNILRRGLIEKKAAVQAGVDYQQQIEGVIAEWEEDKRPQAVLTDQTDVRPIGSTSSWSEDWPFQLKYLIQQLASPVVFYGEAQAIVNIQEALKSVEQDRFDRKHLDKKHLKLLLSQNQGLVGVWGLPPWFNEIVKEKLASMQLQKPILVDIKPWAVLIRFLLTDFEGKEEVLRGFLEMQFIQEGQGSPALLEKDTFIKILKQLERSYQRLEELSRIGEEASGDEEYTLRNHLRHNAECLRDFITLLDKAYYQDYLRSYILQGLDDQTSIVETLRGILPSDGVNVDLDLVWDIYLDKRNSDQENKRMVNLLLRLSDPTLVVAGPIYTVLQERDIAKTHKVLELILRSSISVDQQTELFGVISEAGSYRDVLAAFVLAHMKLYGVTVEANRMGSGDFNRSFFLANFNPQTEGIFSYLTAMDAQFLAGGTTRPEEDGKIYGYSKALDRDAVSPGEDGHTWFTHLREIIHGSFDKNCFYLVKAILYFWQSLDEQEVFSLNEKHGMPRDILDKIVQDADRNGYQRELNKVFDHLHGEGLISRQGGKQAIEEALNLDEEDLTRAIEAVNDGSTSYILNQVGYMLRLAKIMQDKFEITVPNAVAQFRQNRTFIGFDREGYKLLMGLLEKKEHLSALAALSQIRLRIKKRVSLPDIDEDEKAELLKAYNVLSIIGRDLLNIVLNNHIKDVGDLVSVKQRFPALLAVARFIQSSGLGGVELELLIDQLAEPSLSFKQVHDLLRALQTEVFKASQQIDTRMRYVLPFAFNSNSPHHVDAKWNELKQWEKREDGGQRFTEKSKQNITSALIDEMVRDSGLDVFKAALTTFDQVLERQLTDDQDELMDPSAQPPALKVPERPADLDDQFLRFGQGVELAAQRRPKLAEDSMKGAKLVLMSQAGVPVPPGVIISSRLMTRTDIIRSPAFRQKVEEEINHLRQFSKYPDLKLLLYARSGSAFMLPGLMTTLPNIGMNDKEAEQLANDTNDIWFAYDTYATFMRSFAIYVLGIDEKHFQDVFDIYNKENVSPEEMRAVVGKYKKVIEQYGGGRSIPENMMDQVLMAVEAVYASWDSSTAKEYRQRHRISQRWGTVVILQKGVFGNMNETADKKASGTGSATLMTTPDGRPYLSGVFRYRGQGEEIMTHGNNTVSLSKWDSRLEGKNLEELNLDFYDAVLKEAIHIKEHGGYEPLIEFTIERGELSILQSNDDVIRDNFPEFVDGKEKPLVRGKGLSGGAVRGWVANSFEKAKELSTKLKELKAQNDMSVNGIDGIILVIDRVNPEHLQEGLIPTGVHILARKLSVHALTEAQMRGTTVVAEVPDDQMHFEAGRWVLAGVPLEDEQVISIDGHRNQLMYHKSGNIYLGVVSLKDESASPAMTAKQMKAEIEKWSKRVNRKAESLYFYTDEAHRQHAGFIDDALGNYYSWPVRANINIFLSEPNAERYSGIVFSLALNKALMEVFVSAPDKVDENKKKMLEIYQSRYPESEIKSLANLDISEVIKKGQLSPGHKKFLRELHNAFHRDLVKIRRLLYEYAKAKKVTGIQPPAVSAAMIGVKPVGVEPDVAMMDVISSRLANTGGIDLKAKDLQLAVDKEGEGVAMSIDPALLAQFQSPGFAGIEAHIVDITPINGALGIMGLER